MTSAQAKFASLFKSGRVQSMGFSDSNCLAVSCGTEVIVCDSSSWFHVQDAVPVTSFERLTIDGSESAAQVDYSPDSSMLAVTTAVKADGAGCRLLLYASSKDSDGTSEWKVRETRSLSCKGEKAYLVSFCAR